MTNEQHNRYIAFAFLANAGFYLLILLFMIAIFSVVFLAPVSPGDPAPPRAFFGMMMAFMSVFYAIFMIPSLVAGYALLKKKSWARVAGIVAAVVAGMNFPIGTGACAYALWFFFSENWKEVYEEGAFRPFERRQISYGVESQRAAYEAEATADPQFEYREPPNWR